MVLILLHRLAMSSFQPINKARRTSKPTENNSPVPRVSSNDHASSSQAKPREKKKRKSPMVVVPSNAPPQALVFFGDSSNPQTPPRKKKKTVKETPKAPRERAPRDAKLVQTVEHSTTSTPAADVESGSNWSNSSECLENLDSNTSSQTPHRRSPHHRLSCNSSAGLSSTGKCIGSSVSMRLQRPPLDKVSGNAVIREDTASQDRSFIRPRSMATSESNKRIRDRKLEADGLVELPLVEWMHQRYLRATEKKKTEKSLWKNELRKQKGKLPERGLHRKTETPSKAPSAKIVKADRVTQKARKRHKSSHNRVKGEPTNVEAGLQPVQNAASRSEQSEHPPVDPRRDQSGEPALSKKQSKVIVHEDAQPEAVVLRTTSEVFSSSSKGSVPKSSHKEVLPQRSTTYEWVCKAQALALEC